jgi:glyoxylase-like metal-dependent hydrolase (beta-lactamase superfamily II)
VCGLAAAAARDLDPTLGLCPVRVDRFEGGPFAENTYLLTCESTGTRVVVDPGYAARDVLAVLDHEGVAPEAVLLTHAHVDHVDGIPLLIERWPDLPIRLHERDRGYYEAVGKQASWFGLDTFDLPEPTYDLEAGESVRYGDEIELSVRYAPGHAPGHVIFLHEPSGRALVGDVVFRGSIGRTDLPGGDHELLLRSIAREILPLPDATVLLPGHGPETTVAVERRSNPFLQGLAVDPGSVEIGEAGG